MKIIVVNNLNGIVDNGEKPSVVLCADSSMVRNSEPIFLDDNYPDELMAFVPAIRIGRLGMHINPKFAESYLDAHSVMMMRRPKIADNLWFISDRLISPGQWLPGNFTGKEILTVNCADLQNSAEQSSQTYANFANPDSFLKAMVAISAHTTFKTGDILIFNPETINGQLNRNIRITASLDQTEILSLKLK